MSVVEIIGPNVLFGIGILGSFLFFVYFIIHGEWSPEELEDRKAWYRASVAMVIIAWTLFFSYILVFIIL